MSERRRHAVHSDEYCAPRSFPLAAAGITSSKWAMQLWDASSFPAIGSVHVVALKQLMTNVLIDFGETAPDRVVADTITEQLQKGQRHWDASDFLRWCSACETSYQQAMWRSSGCRSGKHGNPSACMSIADASTEATIYDNADRWARCEVEGIMEASAPLTSHEAREKRVLRMLVEVDTIGTSSCPAQPSHLLKDHDANARIEEEVQRGMLELQAQHSETRAKFAEERSRNLEAASAHAKRLCRKAMLNAGASPDEDWHRTDWISLRKAMDNAQQLGEKHSHESFEICF
ncbi:MAG: hypothetical protein SGPRY_012889 [Prymnesium sp.]